MSLGWLRLLDQRVDFLFCHGPRKLKLTLHLPLFGLLYLFFLLTSALRHAARISRCGL